MYKGDGLPKTGNDELDYEILRWFNDRMIKLVTIYIEIGDDTEWDEEYLRLCFPRNFIEDNSTLCRQIVLDIRDILKSSIVHTDMRLLYQYVLFHIIMNEIENMNDLYTEGFEKEFSPIEEDLVKKIYAMRDYTYKSEITEEELDDDDHPSHFIDFLQSEVIFYDVVFDEIQFDIDMCDGFVMYCTEKIKNKEWQPYDLSEVLELVSRPVKDVYNKVIKESNNLDLDDEMFVVQEMDSVIKLLCNRVVDIEKMNENEISNYIEYMLKRLLYLNRNIEIEREAILGFSSVRIGEADMVLFRNSKGYENIAIIENKFYNSNFREIKQLLGYLSMHFKFGVTITINDKRKTSDVIQAMWNYLERKRKIYILLRWKNWGNICYVLHCRFQRIRDKQ